MTPDDDDAENFEEYQKYHLLVPPPGLMLMGLGWSIFVLCDWVKARRAKRGRILAPRTAAPRDSETRRLSTSN